MKHYRAVLWVACLLVSSALSAGTYSNDFESYTDGETDPGGGVTVQTTFTATAVPLVFDHGSNQSFRLTQDGSASGGYTSFELPNLDPGVSVTSFTATFDVLIKDAASAPADGFSFNFGALDTSSYNSSELEDGYSQNGGDVLSITFDTYDNGTGDNFNRVGALLNGTEVAGFDTVNLVLGTATTDPFRGVSVAWDGVGGMLSVSYNGSTVYSNDAISFNPTAGSIFAFGARTGGSDEDVFIDNVYIVTVPEASSLLLALLLCGLSWVGLKARSRR